MDGGVVEHDLVRRVMQKGRPAFHRLKNPPFLFDTQRLRRDALAFGYPTDQGCRLMDIQVVQDDVPLRGLRIAGHQMLNVREGILLSARRSPRGDDDLSTDHIEIDEPG